MSLIDQAREDIERITTDLNEFGIGAVLYEKDGTNPVNVTAIFSHHHLSIDTDGLPVNEMNANCSISFKELEKKGVTFRDASGEIVLRNRILKIEDKWYRITQSWPSETTKLAVCTLSKTDAVE